MNAREVARALRLEPLAFPHPEAEVGGGFCSDLLSRAMAEASPGDAWITYQRHLNVVAVAKLKELSLVILARGPEPEPEVAARAEEAGVNLLRSDDGMFELAGRLYALLAGDPETHPAERG